MIRPAKFGDIIALREMLEAAHPLSKYAGRATFNREQCRRRLFNCIDAHGHAVEGGSWCYVAETDGKVTGLLFGMLQRVEDFAEEMFASDWKFYLTSAADPKDAIRLRDGFVEWAKAQPKVIEIFVGVHDVMNADYDRTARLWEAIGFKPSGKMLTFQIDTAAGDRSAA